MCDSQHIFDDLNELLTQSLQGNSSAQSQIELLILEKRLGWNEVELISVKSEEAIKQKIAFGYTLQAMMSQQDGKYSDAKALYKEAIALGCAIAMINRSMMHLRGIGGEKKSYAAIDLLEKAIALGNIDAMFYLARVHLNLDDEGGRTNYPAAVALFEKASSLEHVAATYNLGIMYRNAVGVPQNYMKAARCLRQAAEKKHQLAIVELTRPSLDRQRTAMLESTFARYHAAMLKNDLDTVLKMHQADDTITTEILFDIHRSTHNDALYQLLLNLIDHLQAHQINVNLYRNILMQISIKRVIECHRKNISFPYDEKSLKNLYQMLAKIKFSDAALDDIPALTEVVVDSWYAASNLYTAENNPYARTAANYLSQLLFKLSTYPEGKLSDHFIRQAMVIIIAQHFGARYEAQLDRQPTLANLQLLLLIIKNNPDVTFNEINTNLGMKLIKLKTPPVATSADTLFAGEVQQTEDTLLSTRCGNA